jgi:hypothetical protein
VVNNCYVKMVATVTKERALDGGNEGPLGSISW